MAIRHFLQFKDFTSDEYAHLFARSAWLKAKFKAFETYHPLFDRHLAMIFEKNSTRTRLSFEAGMQQLGGSSIFRLRHDDPNVSVIIETLTGHGRTPIMAQRFIPEIVNGDKRILLVDGEPVPYALARVPARGETRGNLAAGGSGVPQPLSERDRWIAAQVKDVVTRRACCLWAWT